MRRVPENWVWTELLAFDCGAPDCGVGAYLKRLNFVPAGISLLLSSVDFILDHRGMEKEYALYPDVCSRFGHAGNEERARQNWTNWTLRKLVGELRKHQIKVLVSVFILNLQNRFHEEYVSRHPAFRLGDRVYGLNNAVSMLARLEDGVYLEDVFARKLEEVLPDYGFSGWHAADGQGPGWNLTHSDCSDNFTEQFSEWLGRGRMAQEHLAPAGEDEARMAGRIDYIWRNFHREWADFTSLRWCQFLRKTAEAVHRCGGELMVNSPFAKSIFESVFYFGLDYRNLEGIRIDYLLTESVTTSCSLLYGEYERLFDFAAMIAEMRTVLPEMKLIVMPGVKDVVESYDSLRHAPCRLERDIFVCMNQSVWEPGGARRAADGMLVCLGDGITSGEWANLKKFEEQAFGFEFREAGEMAWFVTGEMFTPLREDYEQFGTPPPYRIISLLTETQALDISTAVTEETLDSYGGPLAVPDFHLHPESLLKKLSARKGLTVFIGNVEKRTFPENAPCIRCKITPGYTLGCVLLNGTGESRETVPDPEERFAFDWRPAFCKFVRNRIPQMTIPQAFLDASGEVIRKNLPERPLRNPEDGARVLSFRNGVQETAALCSFRDTYIRVRYQREAASIASLCKKTGFPYSPLQFSGGLLTLKDHLSPLHLPPQGIVVLEMKTESRKPRG